MSILFTLGAFAFIFDEQARVLLSHRRNYELGIFQGYLDKATAYRQTEAYQKVMR